MEHLLCRDPRCRTLVPTGAEICDECGGTDLAPFAGARIDGSIGDRPVGFLLSATAPNVVGRTAEGQPPPSVDLAKFAASGSVHRSHAEIRHESAGWRIAHSGTNPLVVQHGADRTPVQPGTAIDLASGDRVIVGTVPLRFTSDT